MDREKKEFGKWFMWILCLLVVAIIVFGGLNFLGVFSERIVFKNSFQYKEARNTAIVTYQAQLAEINRLLSGTMPQQTRNDLEAQAASLRILIQAERSK